MSDELNPEQEKAANFKDGVALVLAIPGSGKTRTLLFRICRLVTKHKISPENILGLTFTRNAADEMRNRLIPILGDQAARVKLSTIHSFCLYLLKTENFRFDILSGKEQLIFIRDIMKKQRIDELSVGVVLREISLCKNNLIPIDEFREMYVDDEMMEKIGNVYQAYEDEKEKRMFMDFDDLLFQTYQLLKGDQIIRDKYQRIFNHLLVDEFQDTNPIQMEILKLLMNKSGNGHGSSFWCAGDDAQAVYSFTGASVGNILNFKSIFPTSEKFLMNLCYRSTPQILEVCQNLIKHNERQIHKELKTNNPDGEATIVLESSNEDTEALNLVNEIQDLTENQGYKHSHIAVLYRCNFMSSLCANIGETLTP